MAQYVLKENRMVQRIKSIISGLPGGYVDARNLVNTVGPKWVTVYNIDEAAKGKTKYPTADFSAALSDAGEVDWEMLNN